MINGGRIIIAIVITFVSLTRTSRFTTREILVRLTKKAYHIWGHHSVEGHTVTSTSWMNWLDWCVCICVCELQQSIKDNTLPEAIKVKKTTVNKYCCEWKSSLIIWLSYIFIIGGLIDGFCIDLLCLLRIFKGFGLNLNELIYYGKSNGFI